MQRNFYPNGEVACQIQIAQIWNDLLTLQSHVHQQSLNQDPSWSEFSNFGSLNFAVEQIDAVSQKPRRCRPNRKGLRERLRQKRRSPIAQSPPTSGCDEPDSEGHKIWHSSDESAQAERSRALVVSSELTLLASMQEKLFAYTDQLRTREAGLVERELRVRETELVESLNNERVRADQAAARVEEAEGQTQAAQITVSHLEMALQSESVRAQQAEQQTLELQKKLLDAEVAGSALYSRIDELEEKLRETQIESGTLTARIEKLIAKLRDAEIEAGTLTARNEKLEGKLRESEIESGTLTARNLQLQEEMARLESWFQPEWSCTDR